MCARVYERGQHGTRKEKNEMATSTQIISVCPAHNYLAGFASEDAREDRLIPIICWSAIRFTDGDDPDEVVGQIFDGNCITEATNVDDDVGVFMGYYIDDKEGRNNFRKDCEEWRNEEGEIVDGEVRGFDDEDEEEYDDEDDDEYYDDEDDQ